MQLRKQRVLLFLLTCVIKRSCLVSATSVHTPDHDWNKGIGIHKIQAFRYINENRNFFKEVETYFIFLRRPFAQVTSYCRSLFLSRDYMTRNNENDAVRKGGTCEVLHATGLHQKLRADSL